jgi:hypothetical protein
MNKLEKKYKKKLQYFNISSNDKITGVKTQQVKALEIIEVAGNQCFFYKNTFKKQNYFALVHLKFGLEITPSFERSFKKARKQIMDQVKDNIESIEQAFINRAKDFEIIN